MKRFSTITLILAISLVPALVFSADKFAPTDAVASDLDNQVIVPLTIANTDNLMAIDIPLKWSEGVSLKEVNFEGTRVEDFDLKIANINNDDNVVIIGLVHQTSPLKKEMLSEGEGTVANLVFEIVDPSVREVTIESTVIEAPHHELMFVYNRRSEEGQIGFDKTYPEFKSVTVALSGVLGNSQLPTEFALEQNYPNPFNPTTEIAYSLPVASSVRLDIYNVLGQTVRTLVNGDMPAGNHTITWDGLNEDGGSVSSGVYFYKISANNFVETRKMMMLK